MTDVRVYLASPMTGYDRVEMIERAKYMIALGASLGVTVISPVIEEHVSGTGALTQNSELELYTFWKNDKRIIRNWNGCGSHVVLVDRSDRKSIGSEREYGFNRYHLQKPTVCLVSRRTATVAQWEDDNRFTNERAAFQFIANEYGTRVRRWKWRIKMKARSFFAGVLDELAAWR